MLELLLDAVRPVKGLWGRPRKRPDKLHGDKGYDFDRCRDACRKPGITPRIARRGVESSEMLGRYRWVAERTLAWLARYRRLTVRYERLAELHQAFRSPVPSSAGSSTPDRDAARCRVLARYAALGTTELEWRRTICQWPSRRTQTSMM